MGGGSGPRVGEGGLFDAGFAGWPLEPSLHESHPPQEHEPRRDRGPRRRAGRDVRRARGGQRSRRQGRAGQGRRAGRRARLPPQERRPGRRGAAGSPGLVSGNLVQIPVDVPINLCGNSLNVIGFGNAVFGN
ncbi:chaplin [Streptomyces radicis]|uniref:Chaplin n=1 Tax=Streptomyces radicis TaxID=1750517 RepID=A0A3A9W4X0_9ACTN|nr:chaplin [Streptomyces radicis]RKN20553.1 chaplin [Streptomyces radicis]